MTIKKSYIWCISLALTLMTAMLNVSANESGGSIYGFPVDIFETHLGGYSYHVWGLLFNLVFFYVLLRLISKMFSRNITIK